MCALRLFLNVPSLVLLTGRDTSPPQWIRVSFSRRYKTAMHCLVKRRQSGNISTHPGYEVQTMLVHRLFYGVTCCIVILASVALSGSNDAAKNLPNLAKTVRAH